MSIDRIKSHLIRDQIPGKFLESNDLYVRFIEAYYEWLDLPGNTRNLISGFSDILNIDLGIIEFYDVFKYELFTLFPENIVSDPSTFAKHVKDFYISKGTTKASKFFFRVVYGEDVEIKPYTNLQLDVSSLNYQQRIMRVRFDQVFDYSTLAQKTIYSASDNNKSFNVLSTEKKSLSGIEFIELSISDLTQEFSPSENFIVDDLNFTGSVYSFIASYTIQSGGVGFSSQDALRYSSDGNGSALFAAIDAVSNLGSIQSINIVEPGINYTTAPVVLNNFSGGVGCNIQLNIGTTTLITALSKRFNPDLQQIPDIDFNYYLLMQDGYGDYVTGQTVFQYDEYSNIKFQGTVISWDSFKNILILEKVYTGVFDSELELISTNVSRYSSFTRLLKIDAGDKELLKQFSYTLSSNISVSRYKELYKKNAHPAGLRFISTISIIPQDANGDTLSTELYSAHNKDPNEKIGSIERYRQIYLRYNTYYNNKTIISELDNKIRFDLRLIRSKDYYDRVILGLHESLVGQMANPDGNIFSFDGTTTFLDRNDLSLNDYSRKWQRVVYDPIVTSTF